MDAPRNIIAIGASAGGLVALRTAVSRLSGSLDAAVLAVIHVSPHSNAQNIVSAIARTTGLNCMVAADGITIERGCLYLAPPGKHLLVKDGRLLLGQGPHENKYRPSIDVLFRSVAVNYANRAIGIVLTGMLEDGTSGMWAIKSSGGICIVQNPEDAEFSDMPRSVINKINPDYVAQLEELPAIIENIITRPLPPEKAIPKELSTEARITEKMMSEIDDLKEIGDKSDFICQDCGGGLYEIKHDPIRRFRCHTGHVYSERVLATLKDEKIEE
ncbi:MAG: chemotaxis protein CheB [Flavobacterium sp.]|nr:MAG: chemotaxis protein CheB [Flavobacterium sp.]